MADSRRPAARSVVVMTVSTLVAIAVTGILLAAGVLVTTTPLVPVIFGAIAVGVAVSLADAAAVPAAALITLPIVARVSFGPTNLTVSDLGLAVAALPALLTTARLTLEARRILWLIAGYQFTTLFTVVANPYLANLVEWFHAGVLTAGAVLVGWAVGSRGRAGLGLALLLAVSCALAAVTIVQGLAQFAAGNTGPVYPSWPFPMHKNYAGTVLACAALCGYARPPWSRLRPAVMLGVFWLCAVGLAFTQSRQAIIGLGVALLALVFHRDPQHKRSRLVLLAVVPAVVVVLTTVRDQIASGNEFNPVFVRIGWIRQALEIWATNPIFGVGLRWWYTDRFAARFQPPNAEIEVLTSAGVIGLIAFLIMMLGVIRVLWRMDPGYGLLAAIIMIARFVQSQFDLFWVSVQVSLPFAIVGLCLGAAHARLGSDGYQPPTRLADWAVGG